MMAPVFYMPLKDAQWLFHYSSGSFVFHPVQQKNNFLQNHTPLELYLLLNLVLCQCKTWTELMSQRHDADSALNTGKIY
jgi:hypothetical protein